MNAQDRLIKQTVVEIAEGIETLREIAKTYPIAQDEILIQAYELLCDFAWDMEEWEDDAGGDV